MTSADFHFMIFTVNNSFNLYSLFAPISRVFRNRKFYQEFTALLCNLALLLNSFLPYYAAIPAYAEDASPTPNPVVEEIASPTPEPIVEVTPVVEPTIEPTIEPTVIPTEIPTITPEITPEVSPEIISPTIEPTITNTPENNQSGEDNSQPSPVETITPTPTPDNSSCVTPTPFINNEIEKESYNNGDPIRDSTELDWNYDANGDFYVTREKVKIGVKYIFPSDDQVSVTFKSLPKDDLYRSTLKIKRVKTSDLKLPNSVENTGEYAYDITTDMFDGQFTYDITLPKNENQEAKVSFIEKSLDEAKNNITENEVNSIDSSKLEQQGDKVLATNIDHFTIYIVTTPSSSAPKLSTATLNNQTQVTVSPGETITVSLNVTTSGSGSADDWRSTRYKIGTSAWVCTEDTGNHSGDNTYSESFEITAPAADGVYDLLLNVFNGDSCGGNSGTDYTMSNAINVVSSSVLTPPILDNNPLDTYALNSVTGIWTTITGGSNYQGIGTNEIRWGTPSGAQKSGLRFTNSGLQSFNSGETFYLGMLTHMNWGTYAGTAANGSTLQITLDFNRPNITDPVFTYDFDIEETSNERRLSDCHSGYQQSSTPCDDKVTFPSSYGSQVFTIGDTQFTLLIDGFVNAFPSGSALSSFITEEQRDNSAFLVGHLSSVLVASPQITLVKKSVNSDDADIAPGPSVNVGSAVNFTYVVQNTGDVEMTNISVVDNKGVIVTCPKTTLASGESMTCIGSSVAILGQYTNTAHVHGTYNGTQYNSNDESANYYGVPVPVCGNGIPELNEECDDGNDSNLDTCLNTCVFATCGDNIKNNSEQCDGTDLGGLSSIDFSCNNKCGLELIEDKVTICHSTSSHSNPYITNNPDKSADVSGHDGHNGPVWYPGIGTTWGDIIPPFAYIGGTYPGKNWDTTGQAIWNSGCQAGSTITVVKVLDNTGGGQDRVSDFKFTANDGSTYSFFEDDASNEIYVSDGPYNITEFPSSHYSVSYDQCSGRLKAGETVTCTITNTYIPYCGDGTAYGSEECDDGNSVNNDDCTNLCTLPTCGDGVVTFGEECDDGNEINNDSCTNDCKNATCGDTIVGPGEECDDGNEINNDSCTNDCKNATCGDGYVNSGEECDDGNQVNTDACTNDCYLATCGDGILSIGEQCDQGAENDITCAAPYGDSCSYCDATTCTDQTIFGPYCGDGIKNGEEQCDTLDLGGLSSTDFSCNQRCGLELVDDKVTICHATSSHSNPYNEEEPNKSADVSGHDDHDGEIWYPGIEKEWGDIIPPFAYIGGTYPGQNWTTDGQSIWNNDCNLPKGNLIVKKVLIQDNGANKNYSDFSFNIGGTITSFDTDGQNELSVDPGKYTITEEKIDGYTTTYENCTDLVVPMSGTATCTITNDDVAPKLTIIKEVINDNDGEANPDDFNLTVGGTVVSSGIQNTYLANIPYVINETPSAGYQFISITGDAKCPGVLGGTITLSEGDDITCTITNDDVFGNITVYKFNDLDADGYQDSGENNLSDWTINLTGQTSITTNSDGIATFELLVPGTYALSEDLKDGWYQSGIYCEDQTGIKITAPGEAYGHHGACSGWNGCGDAATCALWACEVKGYSNVVSYGESRTCPEFADCNLFNRRGSVDMTWYNRPGCPVMGVTDIVCSNSTPVLSSGTHDFTLTSGQSKVCRIGNYQKATITINKNVINYDDSDIGNTKTFTVDGGSVLGVSDFSEDSPATFTVNPGTYTFNEINIPNNFELVSNNSQSVTVTSGGSASLTFVNKINTPPTATIAKSNNATGDLSPGSSVVYKIKLKVSGNDVSNFKVVDLLSNGFKYRPGSYNVLVNGSNQTVGTSEPQYHSPGVWNLGDLKGGDEVELTYIADIDSNQQAGTYKDLAYAYGNAAYDSQYEVLASSESLGYVNENFVGTDVTVVKNSQNSISAGVEKQETSTGEVLGVSTDELPATGAHLFWLIISLLMTILGLFFIKKSSKKILILLLIAFFSLSVVSANAISPLTLRVEQPKTPTNISDVNLNYVALDINADPIEIACYKKSPSDSGFTQFKTETLIAGGNASHCALSSILSTEGTYQFYVTATSSLTVTSSTISLDYKTSGPGTPSDYRKDRPNNCDYKIHFKTADDSGKTVRVEIYRADITSFIADNGSKVGDITIGSNQEYDFTNSVPDCNKYYYFVLRAFDSAGNGSSVIGDSVVITSTSTSTAIGTTTTSTGALPVTGINLPTEGELAENPTEAETGEVLGVENFTPSFLRKYWPLLAVLLLIIIGIIDYSLSKKKRKGAY